MELLCVCLALQIDDLQQLNNVFATKALYEESTINNTHLFDA